MARAEKFCEDSLSRCIRNGHLSANWINDGSRWFWYSSEDAEGKNWYLADTKTGKKKQLFDTADFFSKLNESGVKKTAEDFYLSEPEFNETATEFSFDCDKRRFLYNIRKGSLQEIPTKEKRPSILNTATTKNATAPTVSSTQALAETISRFTPLPEKSSKALTESTITHLQPEATARDERKTLKNVQDVQ